MSNEQASALLADDAHALRELQNWRDREEAAGNSAAVEIRLLSGEVAVLLRWSDRGGHGFNRGGHGATLLDAGVKAINAMASAMGKAEDAINRGARFTNQRFQP